MNICIRVDSSTEIGTGHVMRCLSLAEELKDNGHHVYFVCRLHKKNLCHFILEKGFPVLTLPHPSSIHQNQSSFHSPWLGTSQEQDVRETISMIQSKSIAFDWIIIDHYAIDHRWEKEIRKWIPRIMVIDDLADRKHDCDLLVDQNYYENGKDLYNRLVPPSCIVLLGPKYAILRNEFLHLSHLPKTKKKKKSILVTYGGSDPTNETVKAIQALQQLHSTNIKVDIVIGPLHPNKKLIKKLCEVNHFTFHHHISYIGKLMHEADFAICSGGSLTWERYCLGTPGIVTAVADNQITLCKNLNVLEIDDYLGRSEQVTVENMKDRVMLFLKKHNLDELSNKAKLLVDGRGKTRVTHYLTTINKYHPC